jgi:lipoprotein NlpD
MAFDNRCEGLNRSLLLITLLLAVLLSGCGSHTFHKVRPGDTLYSVSWDYNQDYKNVAQWNGLTAPFTIHPGEWLRVAPPTRDGWGNLHPPVPESHRPVPARPAPQVVAKTNPNPNKTIVVKPVKTQPAVSSPSVSNSTAMPDWVWPNKGKVITKFSASHAKRQGIDIGGTLGDKVVATSAGKVVYSGDSLRGYGNLIIIKHNAKYLSAYAHNQRRLVKEGELVKQGQLIAYMGQSEADQVKLHFQIRIDGKPVDPLRYLPK